MTETGMWYATLTCGLILVACTWAAQHQQPKHITFNEFDRARICDLNFQILSRCASDATAASRRPRIPSVGEGGDDYVLDTPKE